jgi:hypothetical protein
VGTKKEQLALIMDCCSPRWSLKCITVIYHNLMESAENGASGRWRYGTVIRHDADSFGRAHRVAVYPAVYRIRPPADPEVAYAASGIASWRASTTSDCPSTETATWPPD